MHTLRRSGPIRVLGLAAALLATACTSSQTSTGPPPAPTTNVASTQPPATVRAVSVPQIERGPVENGPSALESTSQDGFPPPLVNVAEIVSGGPPPDGIPPVDEPLFVPAMTIDWLTPEEPVVALEVGGETRAYPVQIMTWHEIVNDTVANVPVTVSYCPLCNSAVAYDRRVGDRILDFGTSGLLYNSSLVMYDRQTESLWTHVDGRAVVGTLTGETLAMFAVATVPFGEFVDAHPEALVLSRETGFSRDYGRNPYAGYDDPGGEPFLFSGENDDRLPPQTRVVAIRSEVETVVLRQGDVIASGATPVMLDGEPLVIFGSEGTVSALDTPRIVDGRDVGATGVFESTLDGTELRFERIGDALWRDLNTGSEWNLFGTSTSGELEGRHLTPVPHLNTFWFAIAAFEPDSLILG